MPRESLPRDYTYVALDGYEVVRVSEKGICVRKAAVGAGQGTWLARVLIEGGDELDKGDTDIRVADWLATKEGLDV